MSGASIGDFLAMGGYGLYVWGSLGVCAAGLAVEVLLLKRRHQRLERELRDQRSSETGRNPA